MRKTVSIFLILGFCSGCVTPTSGTKPSVEPKKGIITIAAAKSAPAVPVPPKPVEPWMKVTLGMTRAEVSRIMEYGVVVGYEVDAAGVSKPIQIASLYSSEVMTSGPLSYQVDYYVVRSDNAPKEVVEDDLMPMVFQNDILVAKGAEGLKALKIKYQIQ